MVVALVFPATIDGGTTTGGGARSRGTDSQQWKADPVRQGLGGGELTDGRREAEDGQVRREGTWASAGSGGRRPRRGDPLFVAVVHVQARGRPRRVRAGEVQEAREAGVLQMRTGVGDGLRELRHRRRTAGRRSLLEPGGGGANPGAGVPDPGSKGTSNAGGDRSARRRTPVHGNRTERGLRERNQRKEKKQERGGCSSC